MTNSTLNILKPEEWVNQYGDYLYSFAMSRLSSQELAEDLLQETFLSAFQSKDNFKGGSNERTWLISILKRKIADHYRKKSRTKEELSNYDSPFIQDDFMHGQWKEEKAPLQWDVEDEWLQDEDFIKVLKKCISNLPSKWKSIFSMKHIEEVNNAEICEELNVSEANIWTILHRSRLQVRECIERLIKASR